jgi:hypothetical protein
VDASAPPKISKVNYNVQFFTIYAPPTSHPYASAREVHPLHVCSSFATDPRHLETRIKDYPIHLHVQRALAPCLAGRTVQRQTVSSHLSFTAWELRRREQKIMMRKNEKVSDAVRKPSV